ncbi:unnamed protein product [Prorocentrum cordatum]|uniref:Uncharacterized protein n=1 Tax=Prorocentrum cordatum TaxID=2364126 RepID=A0ABN9S9W1_9DINO|nr:unnamed protein product [Polarella glacialis]
MRRTRRDTTRNTFTSKRKPPNKHKKQPRALQRQWYRQRASPAEPSRTTAGPRAAAPAGDGGSQGTPGRLLRSPAGALSTQVARLPRRSPRQPSARQRWRAPGGPTAPGSRARRREARAYERPREEEEEEEQQEEEQQEEEGEGEARGWRTAGARPASRRLADVAGQPRVGLGEHLLAGGTPSTPAGTEGKLRASRAARLARCSTAPLRPASSGARAESPSGRQRRGPRWCRGSL